MEILPLAMTIADGWLPPTLFRLLRGRFGNRFEGEYATWEAAQQACSGYGDGSIVERVATSARAVVTGSAAYERDGVVFDHIEYAWPVLACLLFVASQRGNDLSVLDFGGGLGTSYRQNWRFLSRLSGLSWAIVEQRAFVEAGKREFENGELSFFHDTASAVSAARPNVVLMSGVLQYVPDPIGALDSIIDEGIDFLLFDRTPLIEADTDRLTVQRVPSHINRASYPAWFFARAPFMSRLQSKYSLVEQFDSADRANIPARYQGFLWQKK